MGFGPAPWTSAFRDLHSTITVLFTAHSQPFTPVPATHCEYALRSKLSVDVSCRLALFRAGQAEYGGSRGEDQQEAVL